MGSTNIPITTQHLRNSISGLTIESVKPYVKVSGVIGPSHHKQLKALAEDRKTTIGVLVAAAVRKLLTDPDAAKGLPLDGRRA